MMQTVKNMNILCISAHRPQRAGKVAFELHNNFNAYGYTSKLLTLFDDSQDESIISMYTESEWKRTLLYNKINRKVIQRGVSALGLNAKVKTNAKYQFFEPDGTKEYYSTKRIIKRLNGYRPDVIVVFFTTRFVNVKNFYELARYYDVPVIWHLMDMAPLTGGCHYAWECEGYKKDCGKCPALYSSIDKDLSFKNIAYKKKYTQGYDLRMMVDSEWDYQNTIESSLFKNTPILRTHMSVQPDVFAPGSNGGIRKTKGIAEDDLVIFFGAVHFAEERKGLKYLVQALSLLKDKLDGVVDADKVTLLIAGDTKGFPFEQLPFKYVNVGYLKQVNELAQMYSTADIFLCSSVYDSGPVMINQAIMSGTPVVSFDMGVSRDLVHKHKTGYMAKLRDSEDLAEGLFQILKLSKQDRQQMAENCHALGLEVLHPQKVMGDYAKVFEEIKDSKNHPKI